MFKSQSSKYLVPDRLYLMIEGIVNQLEVSVLVSAPAGLHEMQRSLNWQIIHLLPLHQVRFFCTK